MRSWAALLLLLGLLSNDDFRVLVGPKGFRDASLESSWASESIVHGLTFRVLVGPKGIRDSSKDLSMSLHAERL